MSTVAEQLAAKKAAQTTTQTEATKCPGTDVVNHPTHYGGGIEVIDILKAKLSPEAFNGFLAGNILKYMFRAPHKNGLEDLKKAQWYLNYMIALAEENK